MQRTRCVASGTQRSPPCSIFVSWQQRRKVWIFAFCFLGSILTCLRSLEYKTFSEVSGLSIFMEFFSDSMPHIVLDLDLDKKTVLYDAFCFLDSINLIVSMYNTLASCSVEQGNCQGPCRLHCFIELKSWPTLRQKSESYFCHCSVRTNCLEYCLLDGRERICHNSNCMPGNKNWVDYFNERPQLDQQIQLEKSLDYAVLL